MFARIGKIFALSILLFSTSSMAHEVEIRDFRGTEPIKGKLVYLDIGKFYGTDNWRLHMTISGSPQAYHCYIQSKDLQKLAVLEKMIRDSIKAGDASVSTCFVDQVQPQQFTNTISLDNEPAAFGFGGPVK